MNNNKLASNPFSLNNLTNESLGEENKQIHNAVLDDLETRTGEQRPVEPASSKDPASLNGMVDFLKQFKTQLEESQEEIMNLSTVNQHEQIQKRWERLNVASLLLPHILNNKSQVTEVDAKMAVKGADLLIAEVDKNNDK